MSSKDKYRPEAKRLYLAGISCAQISQNIPVGKTTIDKWRRAERWDDEINKSSDINNFRKEFITFARLLIERVNGKLSNGEDVTSSELSTVAKLAQEVLKDEVRKEVSPIQKDTLSVADAADAVEKYLKGEL